MNPRARSLQAAALLSAFWAGLALAQTKPADAPAASQPGTAADGSYRKWEDDAVMIEVHRSMRFRAPENSLAAVRECYLAGGDAVDCDVRGTLDGVVVCFHDRDPSQRGSGSVYPIGKLTWAEANEVLIEPLSYPRAGQTVVRFEDVLRAAAANNLAIYIDPKESAAASNAQRLVHNYKSDHLLRLPHWPLVYYWTSYADHDVAMLRRLLAATDVEDRRAKKQVTLAKGAPRSFRVDDPRVLAAIIGRRAEARGPWRPPLPELPAPPGTQTRTLQQLHEAMAKGGKDARLASSEACQRFAEESLKLILAGLKGADLPRDLRIEYLWALGQLGHPTGIPALKEHLSSKDAQVREVAAYGLGRSNQAAAVEALLKVAEDEEPMAAAAAAWGLWRIAEPKTAGRLVSLLTSRLKNYKEGNHMPLRMLLLAVGALKCTDAVGVIEEHMTHKQQADNVNAAIAALGAIGGQQAVTAARKLFESHGRTAEAGVFCRAMAVAGPPGTSELIRSLSGKNAREAMNATLALADVPDAVKAIGPLLADGKGSPEAKSRMISILALHKDPAGRALLTILSGDDDKAVAEQARWVLSR